MKHQHNKILILTMTAAAVIQAIASEQPVPCQSPSLLFCRFANQYRQLKVVQHNYSYWQQAVRQQIGELHQESSEPFETIVAQAEQLYTIMRSADAQLVKEGLADLLSQLSQEQCDLELLAMPWTAKITEDHLAIIEYPLQLKEEIDQMLKQLIPHPNAFFKTWGPFCVPTLSFIQTNHKNAWSTIKNWIWPRIPTAQLGYESYLFSYQPDQQTICCRTHTGQVRALEQNQAPAALLAKRPKIISKEHPPRTRRIALTATALIGLGSYALMNGLQVPYATLATGAITAAMYWEIKPLAWRIAYWITQKTDKENLEVLATYNHDLLAVTEQINDTVHL